MKLIDTHVHFWKLSNNINSWVISSEEVRLKKDYFFNSYFNELFHPDGIITI